MKSDTEMQGDTETNNQTDMDSEVELLEVQMAPVMAQKPRADIALRTRMQEPL